MGGNARSISEDWHINENVLIVSKAYSKGRSPFSDFCFLLPASFLTVSVNRKGIQKSRPGSSFFRGKIWDQQTSLKSHFLSQKSGSYQCFFSLFAIYCSEERRVGKPNQPQKKPRNQTFCFTDTETAYWSWTSRIPWQCALNLLLPSGINDQPWSHRSHTTV